MHLHLPLHLVPVAAHLLVAGLPWGELRILAWGPDRRREPDRPGEEVSVGWLHQPYVQEQTFCSVAVAGQRTKAFRSTILVAALGAAIRVAVAAFERDDPSSIALPKYYFVRFPAFPHADCEGRLFRLADALGAD